MIGRGARALEQQRALAVVRRADLQHRAGKPEPVGGVFRGGRDELPEQLKTRPEVIAAKGRFRILAQGRRGLVRLAGVGLDLRLEANGGFGEIVALVGFFGGGGGKTRRGDERGNEAGTEEREHGIVSFYPVADIRDEP